MTRDFALTFLAQFALGSVFHILIPTLPIYLVRSGSTEVEIGVLIGVFGFSSLVLRPFVGRALAKPLERKFMITGALFYVFTSVAYLLAPPFWPFLMVRVLQGIGFAFFHTAAITLIANISSEDRRGQSLSYFTLAFTIAGSLAPVLGMFLVNRFNFGLLFLVCSGLSLCSLIIANGLGRRQITPSPSQGASAEDGFFLRREALPASIISSSCLFIWGALSAFFPIYAINQGMTNPGLFFTTIAVMLIFGRALGGRMLDLHSQERIIPPCLAAYIISMVLLAFSKTLPMFILVAVIWGMGHALLIPALMAYALEGVGSSPGPAMGTFTAVSDLGMCLGPVTMGILLRSADYPIMFLCLALTGALNLSYFYFIVRKKG